MTNNELLAELRALENTLRSAEMQTLFATEQQETRDRFVAIRGELSVAINKLSNARLQDAADKLDELSGELEAGIKNIQSKIGNLNNSIAILNTVSTALGLVARVIAIVS